MSGLSGWCSAPAGFKPACPRCIAAVCTCTCHVPDDQEGDD